MDFGLFNRLFVLVFVVSCGFGFTACRKKESAPQTRAAKKRDISKDDKIQRGGPSVRSTLKSDGDSPKEDLHDELYALGKKVYDQAYLETLRGLSLAFTFDCRRLILDGNVSTGFQSD